MVLLCCLISRVGTIPCEQRLHPRTGDPGGELRHGDQHRGGHLEEPTEGGLPRPQLLLRFHGKLLHCNRHSHAADDAGRCVHSTFYCALLYQLVYSILICIIVVCIQYFTIGFLLCCCLTLSGRAGGVPALRLGRGGTDHPADPADLRHRLLFAQSLPSLLCTHHSQVCLYCRIVELNTIYNVLIVYLAIWVVFV